MRVAQSLHARLRSTTGVVIGLYVTMHLSNHALGLVSQNAQEAARPYVMALWHSLPGPVLLYGSLVTHAVCALIALARRREFRPALKVNLLPSITLRLLLLCLACLGLTRRMSAAPIAGEISKDTALFLPEFPFHQRAAALAGAGRIAQGPPPAGPGLDAEAGILAGERQEPRHARAPARHQPLRRGRGRGPAVAQ